MTLGNGPRADSDPVRKPSTAELESEIGRSRRRIDLTLDALTQRLAPRRLLQKGMEMVSRFAGTVGRSGAEPGLRLDPLALGLIGAGIAWLVAVNAGRRRRRKPSGGTDTPIAEEGSPEGPISAPDSIAAAEPCGGEAQSPAEPAAGAIETHPLLLGLAGLALGAALAAVLPPNRGEREAITRTREDLWRKAEALGHRAASRIRDAGRCSPPPSAE